MPVCALECLTWHSLSTSNVNLGARAVFLCLTSKLFYFWQLTCHFSFRCHEWHSSGNVQLFTFLIILLLFGPPEILRSKKESKFVVVAWRRVI